MPARSPIFSSPISGLVMIERTAGSRPVFCCLCNFLVVRSNEGVTSKRISQTDIRRLALPDQDSPQQFFRFLTNTRFAWVLSDARPVRTTWPD